MNKRRVSLCVEELEPRQVPSAVLAHSSNWSGYAVSAGAGAVSAVSATWKVPIASGSTQGYEAYWVGIDGLNSRSVEQIGTESDFGGGQSHYYAWYEMYPSPALTIMQPIKPGDEITASVSYGTGGFTLTIDDAGWSRPFTTTVGAAAQRSSAEWIVEAPSSDHVLPLANFGSTTFTNVNATIGKNSGAVNSAPGTQVVQIDMVSQHGSLADQTSALNAAGTAFTVAASGTRGSSGSAGRGTAGRAARFDNNQTVSLTAVPPPDTVSPELVLVQQFTAASVTTTPINFSAPTPATPVTFVPTGAFLASGFGAATAPNENALTIGMAAPEGTRQAADRMSPVGMPPAAIPPAGMPPAEMPPSEADLSQARRVESAATDWDFQQANTPQALVQDIGISIDLANTPAASVSVAGVVLLLASSGWCGIGVSDPTGRLGESPRFRNR